MRMQYLAYLFGVLSILICLITWGMDLTHLVGPCIYCRTQRTIIGLLGIMMLLPNVRIVVVYFTTVVGFLGAYVASDQLFQDFIKFTSSPIVSNEIYLEIALSACALFIIIAQVIFIYYRAYSKNAGY